MLMPRRAVFLLVAALAGVVRVCALEDWQHPYDQVKYVEFEAGALKKETEGVWKRIGWQKDAESALKKARAEQKLLLVILIVNQLGGLDDDFC